MSDTQENEVAEHVDTASLDDDGTDTASPSADPVDDNDALSHGPTRSFGLSLLSLAMLFAFLGVRSLFGAESQQDSPMSIALAALMALSLLIAMPSWIVSTVYAIGSLVTMQRRVGLALLALLVNAASAVVFLQPN